MRETIFELRETIRRLRPHLLVSCEPQVNSVGDEMQLESVKDLVNSIAGFIWSLDQLWESCLSGSADDSDEKKTSSDVDHRRGRGKHPSLEPQTEWNDEAKSLIRAGYGILYSVSSPTTDNSHQQRHHIEELRCVVRTSILELLPSLSTSPCRHFLLGFLSYFSPLFIPSAKEITEGVGSRCWSPPSWLRHDNSSEHAQPARVDNAQSRADDSIDFFMQQILETFESLIQTDPSTLAPFLATMSLLLPDEIIRQSEPAEETRSKDRPGVNKSADSIDAENTNFAFRKKCCSLCISSLPSISEHDLPSVIHSLFTLVCDKDDGLVAVQAIRRELISISTSHLNEDLVLFMGNVIVPYLLSEQVVGAEYIALGFLEDITETLREHFEQLAGHDDSEDTTVALSTIDAIVITALYSRNEYQQTIEALIDSLLIRQSSIVLDFVLPLIRIWSSRNCSSNSCWVINSNQSNLLMYEELAAPLVSLLFYLIIASSTSQNSPEHLDFVCVGGIMPFRHSESTIQLGIETSQALRYSCCKAFEKLYSVLDAQRQEQAIISLMSMISGPFIQSSPVWSTPRTRFVAAAYSACCSLLLILHNHHADTSSTTGAVIHRLLQLASQSRDDVNYVLFDMNSALLVGLLQRNDNPSGVSELLIMCQKLLLSPNYKTKTVDPDNCHRRRVICGIILAARLMRCDNINRLERRDIWDSVVKVLSPVAASPVSRYLNPEIGTWGLSFLKFVCSSLNYVLDIPSFVDTSPICGERDVFNIINNMLAVAGVIQMENELKVPSTCQNGDAAAFLAFDIVPVQNSVMHQKEMQSLHQAPRFVVNGPYFLSMLHLDKENNQDQLLDSINHIAAYAYDLVDCYLRLGKSREHGWNPRGWLLSKVQLPCAMPESVKILFGTDKGHRMELDYQVHPNASQMKTVITDILNHKNTRAAAVKDLAQFMNAVIVSISISCAVLRHANEHYLNLFSRQGDDVNHDTKTRRRLVALQKLLNFQLAKIYHMQDICERISFILKGINAEVYRMSQAQTCRDIVDKSKQSPALSISLSKLKSTTGAVDSFLESRANHISWSTLWSCLLCEESNSISLCKAFNKATSDKAMSETSKNEALRIIRLRIKILEQLQQLFRHQSRVVPLHMHAIRGIPHVYKCTLDLCSYINNLGEQKNDSFDETSARAYTASHFKLLLASFSAFTNELPIQLPISAESTSEKMRTKCGSVLGHFDRKLTPNFFHLIQACASKNRDQGSAVKITDIPSAVLAKQLLRHFEKCQDASTICQIIDLVSILTVHTDLPSDVLICMTKNAVSSVYNPSSVSVDAPYLICKIGHALKSSNKDSPFRASFSRLFQTTSALFKAKSTSINSFAHNLLSHWSILFLSDLSQSKFITTTLEGINEVIEITSMSKPTRSGKRIFDVLPGLNERCCVPAFELLLYMLTTSLSLSKPKCLCNEKEIDQYTHVTNCFGLLRKTLDTFRLHRLFFPGRTFFKVTNASHLAVKLGTYHLKQCLEWRSSQRCSLQSKAQLDTASPNSLQPLLESIARDCIGTITKFCDSIKSSDQRSGLNHKHFKAIALLSHKCKGLEEYIYSVCKTHNLRVPDFISNNHAEDDEIDSENKHPRKRCLTKPRQVKKRQCPDRSTKTNILEEFNESPESSDNSYSKGSDNDRSFGVMGNWG